MIGTIADAWVSLASAGFAGFIVALVLAAFAVLVAGNVVIWTLVGIKAAGRVFAEGYRSAARR